MKQRLIDRIASWIKGDAPISLGVARPRPRQRTYQAALQSRLTSDWSMAQTTANSELRHSLRNLRARSRELARNSDYIKKFLSMVVSNVVGPSGIKLQVRAKQETNQEGLEELDDVLNQTVEEAWEEWSRKHNASLSGKLSWVDLQRLFIRTMARDGEVLVRKIVADNPFGFALQFIDVAWLDETFNNILPNGHRILMSVEVDKNNKPVAYHLTPPPTDFLYAEYNVPRYRTRVPADEIIHAFLVIEDEMQVRGVPWAHTAMHRLQILGGYEEAELVAARVGACKMAYLMPPEDDSESLPDAETDRQMVEEMQPGITQITPAGWTVKDIDPTHPNSNYSAFHKAVLRGVASGLDVSYVSLANDLEGVSYSSIRAGLLEERDLYKALQGVVIEHLCRPVFNEWKKSAMLSGALTITTASYTRLRDFWQPRGWDWVDPLNDIQAAVMASNNAYGTRTEVLGARGVDFPDLVKQLAAEAKMLEAAGIKLPVPGSGNPAAEAQQDTPKENAPPVPGKKQFNIGYKLKSVEELAPDAVVQITVNRPEGDGK